MKLLIVDDSVLIRERVVSLIEESNDIEIVEQAKNCKEAIHYITNNSYDIVILDISLPDGSGLFVLKKIKQYKPETRVIMLTNYPFLQYKTKCKELGAEYFLHKLNDFNRIPDVIRSLRNLLEVN